MGRSSTLDKLWMAISRAFYPNWVSVQYFIAGWEFFFEQEKQNLIVLATLGILFDFICGSVSLFNIIYRVLASVCIRKFLAGGICSSEKKMDGQTVIITGANVGIGKDTAKDMLQRGARVIMACRDLKKGEVVRKELVKVSKKVELRKLDLSNLTSVREFANGIIKDNIKIHVLINNAGVMMCPYTETVDGFELQMATNHLGPFLLTNLLLPQLKHSQPSRIVNVSSAAHLSTSIDFKNIMDKNTYDKEKAYLDSKLANVLFTHQLSKLLKGSNVSVFSLHPGVVNTEITRHVANALLATYVFPLFMKSSAEGAQTTIYCVTEAEQHPNMYFSDCSVGWPQPAATDDFLAETLWNISEELVKPKQL